MTKSKAIFTTVDWCEVFLQRLFFPIKKKTTKISIAWNKVCLLSVYYSQSFDDWSSSLFTMANEFNSTHIPCNSLWPFPICGLKGKCVFQDGNNSSSSNGFCVCDPNWTFNYFMVNSVVLCTRPIGVIESFYQIWFTAVFICFTLFFVLFFIEFKAGKVKEKRDFISFFLFLSYFFISALGSFRGSKGETFEFGRDSITSALINLSMIFAILGFTFNIRKMVCF